MPISFVDGGNASVFYSPSGNPELWHEKPDGYLTPEEWAAANPAPEPEVSADQALAAKLAEVMRGYSVAFAPIEAVYPAAEREGWAVQEAEARALLADPEAETPVLSALVQLRARGETAAQLAASVLENAGKWRMVYAFLTGQQQRMYGEVTHLAAQEGVTAADILAYPVEYGMPEGV